MFFQGFGMLTPTFSVPDALFIVTFVAVGIRWNDRKEGGPMATGRRPLDPGSDTPSGCGGAGGQYGQLVAHLPSAAGVHRPVARA